MNIERIGELNPLYRNIRFWKPIQGEDGIVLTSKGENYTVIQFLDDDNLPMGETRWSYRCPSEHGGEADFYGDQSELDSVRAQLMKMGYQEEM